MTTTPVPALDESGRAAVIRLESDRLADAVAAAPQAPVPTCPGWTATDLLAHLTRVHDFWAHVIGDRLDAAGVEAYERDRPDQPSDLTGLLTARADATTRLLAALGGRPGAEHAWSWFPADQSVGFTWRMQTHEATMHRVDAELAAGRRVTTIDPPVAVDGVSHALDVMWSQVPDDADRTVVGIVELHATDVDRTWHAQVVRWSGAAWGRSFTDAPGLVHLVPGELRRGIEPDATVRAGAHDLDLLLWTRPTGALDRSGDEATLAVLDAALAQGLG